MTASTSPVFGSVTVNGASPPTAFMPPWQPAQLNPPSAVGAKSSRTPAGEPVVPSLLGAGLAARFEHPVQRQGDDDDREQEHADQLDALEARTFERLVVEVRLAVGGEFDLRTDLLAPAGDVEDAVDDPPDGDDDQTDDGDRGGRRGEDCCGHQ